MNFKTPNPASLGLAGFALTTWLLSMINAGWFTGDAMGMVLAVAFAYGGTAQALAGLMEIPRGNTFGATPFLSYGDFWWSPRPFVLFPHEQGTGAFIWWDLFQVGFWGGGCASFCVSGTTGGRPLFLVGPFSCGAYSGCICGSRHGARHVRCNWCSWSFGSPFSCWRKANGPVSCGCITRAAIAV